MQAQVQHAYEVTAPENWPLQLFAETGVLGLAAALAALAFLLWPLRERARAWAGDPGRSGLCLALLACSAACLACNLASLDLFLPSTLLPWALMLALGTVLGADSAPRIPPVRNADKTRFLASAGIIFLACVPPVEAELHAQAGLALAQARALSQAGRFVEAAPKYGLALEYDPSLLEARYFLGCSLQDAGGDTNLANAAQCFAVLQRYAPDYVQVHARLGRLHAQRGQIGDAAAEYTRQLQLDPWDLASVQALASLYAEHGALAQSRDVLAAAAARWPADRDIARNLATVELALKRGKGKP
jgi:tetratricopeptide (TPR) repeat protein